MWILHSGSGARVGEHPLLPTGTSHPIGPGHGQTDTVVAEPGVRGARTRTCNRGPLRETRSDEGGARGPAVGGDDVAAGGEEIAQLQDHLLVFGSAVAQHHRQVGLRERACAGGRRAAPNI